MAILSEVVNEGSEIDQTEINFNTISNTLANVTSFVTNSNTIINETVSGWLFKPAIDFEAF